MQRQAVDAIAAKYWSSYFKDSGYGALWVKKVPMRLRAAFAQEGHFTGGLEPEFAVLGHAIDDDKVSVEGVARSYGHGPDGSPQRVARAFTADFSHEGELVNFVSLPSP